jgi:N-formylglutamate amidohydrolase
MLLGSSAPVPALLSSPKVVGGLGVIPSRIAAGGVVWARPLGADEIERRLAATHRPYHAAIAAAMDEAFAVHGAAILIDCHSMPPLGHDGARIVIGDRHGRSAEARFVTAAVDAARDQGVTVARNHPYAGGHTLDRHGRPQMGRHAIQIEVDRSLYLDAVHHAAGEGLARTRTIVARIAAAIEDEMRRYPLAAE